MRILSAISIAHLFLASSSIAFADFDPAKIEVEQIDQAKMVTPSGKICLRRAQAIQSRDHLQPVQNLPCLLEARYHRLTIKSARPAISVFLERNSDEADSNYSNSNSNSSSINSAEPTSGVETVVSPVAVEAPVAAAVDVTASLVAFESLPVAFVESERLSLEDSNLILEQLSSLNGITVELPSLSEIQKRLGFPADFEPSAEDQLELTQVYLQQFLNVSVFTARFLHHLLEIKNVTPVSYLLPWAEFTSIFAASDLVQAKSSEILDFRARPLGDQVAE